jgi:hypothetical protein
MPQQLLHMAHVRSPIQEMRGEGMPQRVWMEPADSDGFSMRPGPLTTVGPSMRTVRPGTRTSSTRAGDRSTITSHFETPAAEAVFRS